MAEKASQKTNMLELADFLLFFCGEREPDQGEDSFAYALNEAGAMVSVFDGCGGSGAGRYEKLQDRTGAYLAARAASAACLRWFEELDGAEDAGDDALKARILENLELCERKGGRLGLNAAAPRAKRLPTTAAAAVCRPARSGMELQLRWAGDSRVYWLDEEGLAQLTWDDAGGLDPMEKLSQDPPLSNAITLSRDFQIHSARLTAEKAGLLLAATDGCFGYYSTPMEFEYLLLSTLEGAENAAAWEDALKEAVGRVTGDDYTLCALCLGFGSFQELKRRLLGRTKLMERVYITGLDACSPEEKQLLWERYKSGYLRRLCRS